MAHIHTLLPGKRCGRQGVLSVALGKASGWLGIDGCRGRGQVRPLKDRVWNIGVSAFLESRIQGFFFGFKGFDHDPRLEGSDLCWVNGVHRLELPEPSCICRDFQKDFAW